MMKSGRAWAKVLSKYHAARAVGRRVLGFPVVKNANRSNDSDRVKRALLVYLVKPFRLRDDDPRFLSHQNLRQSRQIASVLDELGYIVDVADIQDQRFRPSSSYDLVISHRVDLATESLHRAVCAYLATGMNHRVHNRNVRARYDDLYGRSGCRLKEWRLHTEAMPFLDRADAVLGFGNDHTVGTWRDGFDGPIYAFNNYGFATVKFAERRRHELARRNFLFFASQDQVAKGLDLLLEVFARHPDLGLYVCSDFESEAGFCRCYHDALFRSPRIHPIGRVSVGTPQFYELAESCAFVVLPTCAEGCAGSVVQCMFTGLIPIVTAEAGIDARRFGIMLPGSSIEVIEKAIVEAAQLPEERLRLRSSRTREIAKAEYSEAAFVDRWRAILTELVARGDKRP